MAPCIRTTLPCSLFCAVLQSHKSCLYLFVRRWSALVTALKTNHERFRFGPIILLKITICKVIIFIDLVTAATLVTVSTVRKLGNRKSRSYALMFLQADGTAGFLIHGTFCNHCKLTVNMTPSFEKVVYRPVTAPNFQGNRAEHSIQNCVYADVRTWSFHRTGSQF